MRANKTAQLCGLEIKRYKDSTSVTLKLFQETL